MTDSDPSSLASQTLRRLQKLAEGNNLSSASIELVDAQEHVYQLTGIMVLVPFCERQPGRPAEAIRDVTNRQNFSNFAALQAAMQNHQQKFLESDSWIEAARQEVRGGPHEGWGLDGVRVTLPSRSALFSASETCPTCRGRRLVNCTQCQAQGSVTCSQCQGRGKETCYNCGGRGENPAHPGQPCIVCQGNRVVPCRFCRGTGKLVCPTCNGQRGTPCPQCHGQGRRLQEFTLVCGAVTKFKIGGENLPSGLRRGLERIGVANLGKGHADIKMVTKKTEEEEGSAHEDEKPRPEIHYEASLPYADLRMRFGGGRVTMVNVFGKRGFLMGVPPFLDEALQSPRGSLAHAADGEDTFDAALEARAIREALIIDLRGKGGDVKELRRLYPIGLSPAAAASILKDMKRALTYFTKRVRVIAAVTGSLIGVGILAGWFLTPLNAVLTRNMPIALGALADGLMFALALGFGWVLLSKAVQIALRRRFPHLHMHITMRRPIGPVGYTMLTFTALAGIATMFLAPLRPVWLETLLAMFGHH